MKQALFPALLLAVAATQTFGQVVRTMDHRYHGTDTLPVVSAYALTPEQEGWFDAGDGTLSRFWYAWELQPTPNLSAGVLWALDNWTSGPSPLSSRDVECVVRFAYGALGVYVLLEVNDDDYGSGVAPTGSRQDDAMSIFVEKRSAATLYGSTAPAFPCIDSHQLTGQFLNIQTTFRDIGSLGMGVGWPNSASSDLCDAFSVMDGGATTESQLTQSCGISVEILAPENTWRRQEWLIPWDVWGGPNGPTVTPGVLGNRFAMCFGYDDMDVEQDAPSSLWWRKASPLAHDIIPGGHGAETSVDAWGEMLLDRSLDTALAEAGLSWDPGYPKRRSSTPGLAKTVAYAAKVQAGTHPNCFSTVRVTWHQPLRAPVSPATARVEFYSLSGRRVPLHLTQGRTRSPSIIIERTGSADGRSASSTRITLR